MEDQTWPGVVPDDLLDPVHDALREIAEGVRRHPSVAGGGKVPVHPTLPGGLAGIAIFYAYLHWHSGDDDHRRFAESLVDRCIELVAELDLSPALHGGFLGTSWALHHLAEMWGEEDMVGEIDEAMVEILEAGPWNGDYDLILGLVGFAIYALDRRDQPAARRILELVVDNLGRRGQPGDQGITWFTQVGLLPAHQAKEFPEGYHNLGLAHGIPGVVGVLGQMVGAGLGGDRVTRLFDASARWLLAHETADGTSCFQHILEDTSRFCRVAWCYGDLGLGLALGHGARAAGRTDLLEEAHRVLAKAALRHEDAGVRDAGICHGSLGNALGFQRAGQLTGDPQFLEAASRWVRHGLDHRRPEGIAGFPAYMPMPDVDDLVWRDEVGLLTGAAGVGLGLLAALGDVEPRWDRCLLLSSCV